MPCRRRAVRHGGDCPLTAEVYMLLSRWESTRGAHFVELHSSVMGFAYRGNDCGGVLKAKTIDGARRELQTKIDSGYFLPDAAKVPMRKVSPL